MAGAVCIWLFNLPLQTAVIVGAALCGGVLLIESVKAVVRGKQS